MEPHEPVQVTAVVHKGHGLADGRMAGRPAGRPARETRKASRCCCALADLLTCVRVPARVCPHARVRVHARTTARARGYEKGCLEDNTPTWHDEGDR